MFGETPQPKAKYAYLINTIGQDGADLSLQEPKTSSEAEDFSIFGSRRPLNLQEPKTSQSLGAEDLFGSRRLLNLQEPKTS
ncbi:hypothetical protein L6452_44464 [Arctium lappa]|uniref:Uncharacterized protein n=1 Tax=Arctium lappa TaxID=4217 RepID=A0ACB8XHK9_ARCLA|nr:hypothetical protein L6452_44464 [Arctium lappa]